jgi:hypothetical protein
LNFFGHAAVACWRSELPSFVLGAMLPDFATMIHARPPSTRHVELGRGIAFHHATDAAFHATPTFRSLMARANAELQAGGVRRGSARAAAHVGVEILLDAELAREDRARLAYLAALTSAIEPALALEIEWRDDTQRARFAELCRMLESRGLHAGSVSPELVSLRLARALAGHPRLALDSTAEKVVTDWARAAAPVVAESAPTLLEELRRGLAG